MGFNKFAIKDAADCFIYKKSTGELYLYADYANVTTNEWSAESVYAKEKGVNAIGFDYDKQGNLKLDFEVMDKKMLAILCGSDFVSGGNADIFAREVVTLDAEAGTATLSDAPIEGSVSVFELEADGTNKGEAAETVTVAEKVVTCAELKGKKVAVFYQKSVAAEVLTVNAQKFAENFHIVGKVMIKSTDGALHLAQFDWLNCKPKANFTITLDASSIATISMECELLADSDGSGDMCRYVFTE